MINNINDTEKLVENFIEKVLPTYSMEEWAQMAYKFRKRNWTSQGTYIYLKWSPLSKETQDELMTLLEREEILDLQNEVYPHYYALLWDEIITDVDFSEELQDVEEGTDEYYELIDELIQDTECINPPQRHLILALMDKIAEYDTEIQVLIETFEMALDYEEYHKARLWEIICFNNNFDYDDKTIGELYDKWYNEYMEETKEQY